MKIFNIDSFKIGIEDELFKDAVKYGILEEGISEEEKLGNYYYIKNMIRASSCKTIDDLKVFTYENLRKAKTDKEISEGVCQLLLREVNCRRK